MDIIKLKYFESVSRLKSFTKAAAELHVAQPSITVAIGKLEEELGVSLLVRNSRQVELTFEGELFRKKTIYLLKIFSETIVEMQAMGSKASQFLNIGIPPMVGAHITPKLYGEFLIEHPEIKLNILEKGSFGILDALNNDKIELGYIVLEDHIESKYNIYPTVHGEIHVLLSVEHPLAKSDKIPIEMLKDVKLIDLPEHTFIRRKVDAEFVNFGIEPAILAIPDQMITTINLVSQNLGVSFVLGTADQIINENKQLTTRPFVKAIPFRTGFIWLKDKKLSSAANKCMKYMKEIKL